MEISFIASPNFHIGRDTYTPIAIVIHIMEGTLLGTDSWFQNPKSQVSAHFGVGKTGEIHQYVLQTDSAWHAGRVNNPSWRLIKSNPVDQKYINPNFYTIGIEHEGNEDSTWTDAMYQSSSELIAGISKRWNIPIDRDHIIGHHEIYSLKTCPGTKVDFDKLIQMASAINLPGGLADAGPHGSGSEAGTPPSEPGDKNTPDQTPVYNIYTKVVKSGKATTKGEMYIRSGPGQTLPIVAIAPANIQLAFDGYVDNGMPINNNARWYYTDEGNWFWSGAVK